MKNKIPRIMATMLMAVTILTASAIPALAANTGDASISNFTISALVYTPITARSKTDSTPVYLYYTGGSNSSVKVQTQGGGTLSGSFSNYTLSSSSAATYVTCRINVQYSIHSSIHESGLSFARLGFRSQNTALPETISGVWSPDSAGTYADATT